MLVTTIVGACSGPPRPPPPPRSLPLRPPACASAGCLQSWYRNGSSGVGRDGETSDTADTVMALKLYLLLPPRDTHHG